LAGSFDHLPVKDRIYAGAPKETYFWTAGTLVAPGGKYIYCNSGDELVPRRIAVDGSEPVATLFADGRWVQCKTQHQFGADADRGFLVGSDRHGRVYIANGTRLNPESK
jgi:hypothetical protein